MLFFRHKAKLSTIGICPACFGTVGDFKSYDPTNLDEFYKNICPECCSEALDVGYENLFSYLISNSKEAIEAKEKHWNKPETKKYFDWFYWRKTIGRIRWLKKLKQTFTIAQNQDIEIKI